jgi:hypothetical protein
MSSLSTQKGTGFFQNLRKRVLNTLSGRRTIRKKPMESRKLSDENEERKRTLKQKRNRTKNESTELSVLTAKLAPKEEAYRAGVEEELEARAPGQKVFNNYGNKKVAAVYPYEPNPFYKDNQRNTASLSETDLEVFRVLEESERKETITVDIRTGAPAKPTTPEEFVKTLSLPSETTYDGKCRALAYLYDMMKGVDTTTEEYLNDVKYITIPQRVEMSHVVRPLYRRYKGDPDSLERIAEEAFHTDLGTLNEGIFKMERYGWAVKSPSHPSKLFFANHWGSVLGRYIRNITNVRSLDYEDDESTNICRLMVAPGLEERPSIQSFTKPMDKHLCIAIFGSMQHFRNFVNGGTKGYSNYIILHPEYLSFEGEKAASKNMPIAIVASYFLKCRMVQDAFKEQAVDTMDENLFLLIRKHAPELFEAAKVTVATPKYLKKLPFKALFTERFLLLKEDYLPQEIIVTYKNPLLLIDVANAMKKNRGFLFADPYTTYCIKKKDPAFWHETFGARFNEGESYNVSFSVYTDLTDTEKFLVDFYQFAFLLDRLQLRNNSGLTDKKLLEASDVYRLPINSAEFVEFVKENSGLRDETFKEFLKMQKLVRTYDKPFTTSSDVFRFLQKFARTPVSFPGTNVNIENANYLNRYFRQQRRLAEGIVEPRVREEPNEDERPRTSERPLLSLRRPLEPVSERLARLQAQIALRKSERNAMLRNSVVFNAQTRRKKNRSRVNKMYANMARIARTRGERERIQVKRNAARAKFNRLEAANLTIQSLEQQLRSAMPLPASPGRTLSSTNTVNLPSSGTVA